MVAEGEYRKILATINAWPSAEQFALASEVLATLGRLAPRPRDTLSKAKGLLRADDPPPPPDEKVSIWIGEHRLDKYGQG